MNPTQINLDLCRALGVADPDTVTRVTLEILPHELPRLTVERAITTADGLATAAAVLHLVPVHTLGPAMPDATERPGPHTA